MLVVLAGATFFTGNGFGGLTYLLVVLAGAAILTGGGFRGLPNLLIVLAGAAIFTGLNDHMNGMISGKYDCRGSNGFMFGGSYRWTRWW